MSLDTTTSDPVESAEAQAPTTEATADTSQEDNQTEAVNKDEDTSQTSDTVETTPGEEAEEATPDNVEETEIKEWAAKKNLPLDDPIKIAKMYRESEKQLGKKGQQEGQLKAAVTGANESAGVDDVQALRNEVTALSFYIQHPEAKQYEPEMVQILEDKPWLANDLDVVLDAAKGRSSSEATKLVAERQAGKKEALAQAEQAGRAALPVASASDSSKSGSNRITSDNVDEQIGRHMGDTKWYEAHKAEIDAALAG